MDNNEDLLHTSFSNDLCEKHFSSVLGMVLKQRD